MFRFLHLSDIHVGNKSQVQIQAINSLVESILKYSGGLPYDLVILSGDLVYSGRADEYTLLTNTLITPLRKSDLFKNAQFVSVPGNHDSDCQIAIPSPWDTLGAKRQEAFFEDSVDGRRLRAPRVAAFKNYSDFIQANNITGCNPLDKVADKISLLKDGARFHFITINTALFSDVETSDEEVSPMPVPSLRPLLENLDPGYIFIVGHHPMDWFTNDTVQKFRTLLFEKDAIYFHGHLHQIGVGCNSKGICSLGFGAAYQQTLDSKPKPGYKNSFAICQINNTFDIAPISWESEPGAWRPPGDLPVDFHNKSKELEHGYTFNFPFTKILSSVPSQKPGRHSVPDASKLIWLGEPTKENWVDLLMSLNLIPDVSGKPLNLGENSTSGALKIIIPDGRRPTLLYAISAPGHVLSYGEVEKLNTEMDSQDLSGVTIATVGAIADEARVLADRLARNKAFVLHSESAFLEAIPKAVTKHLMDALLKIDWSECKLNFVIDDLKIYSLVEDKIRNEWFYLVGPDGKILSETDKLTQDLRKDSHTYANTNYGYGSLASNMSLPNNGEIPEFSEQVYRAGCYEIFNDIRYAPLAAIGMKFADAKLKDVYIPASAQISTADQESEAYGQQIKDLMDSLGLDEGLRDQIESTIKEYRSLPKPTESGDASLFYQQHPSLLVTGDPGSGKTCFTKNEVLQYCKPNQNQKTWYSEHLPIYVPLAEAAKLIVFNDPLKICVKVVARYGLNLPEAHLRNLLSEGRVAFFFDGIDEVNSLKERSTLVSWISDLITQYSSYGNRFVCTSRPAAVQVVDISPNFKTIQLHGLTDAQMRALATKVMSARINSGSASDLNESDREIIEKLLEDCRTTPGIKRIAKNPLLLTLLVLIYANSGAPTAKRHRIYTQAVKTLVTVRNRKVGGKVLSESDLRIKLGMLALAIFRRDIDDIPTLGKVVSLLSKEFKGGLFKSAEKEAEQFIQEVAETTGLLQIHSRSNDENKFVSFMHYSFLEYYAALGFLNENDLSKVYDLSKNPRWKEVITLIAGMLSEHQDVTEFVRSLLADRNEVDKISKGHLLFALDCALETEVPPDKLQSYLAVAVNDAIQSGPAKVDGNFREDLAKRLSKLLDSSGSVHFREILLRGMESKEPQIRAAYLDIISRLSSVLLEDSAIISAFDDCTRDKSSIVLTTAIEAVERRAEFRTQASQELILRSLKGSTPLTFNALKAIEKIPAYGKNARAELIGLLDSKVGEIASLAARALLTDNQDILNLNHQEHMMLSRCIGALEKSGARGFSFEFSIGLSVSNLKGFLSSPDKDLRVLGIRLLPWLKEEGRFVHDTIFQIIKSSTDHEETKTALNALRNSQDAFRLLTISDTSLICELLGAETRNVRIATIALLAQFPSEEQVVSALSMHTKGFIEQKIWSEEFQECLIALAAHAPGSSDAREFLLEETYKLLPDPADPKFGDENSQKALAELLRTCRELTGYAEEKFCNVLKGLADSFKTPMDIRTQCIQTYAKLSRPSAAPVEFLLKHLTSMQDGLAVSSAFGIFDVIKHSRKRFEHITLLHQHFNKIVEKLEAAWKMKFSTMDQIDSSVLKYIRRSLIEIELLEISYSEFADRIGPK